jgi:hypothetical protein
MGRNSWFQTNLHLYEGEPWEATAHSCAPLTGISDICPDHLVSQSTIIMRRIGWIDQKGRIWKEAPHPDSFDGGSLTPLLINPGCD